MLVVALSGACDDADDQRTAAGANPTAPPVLIAASEPGAPAPPARSPNATVLPTATALPYALDSSPSQPPPLARWTPTLLPLFFGLEAPDTYVAKHFGEPLWRVFRIEGAGAPELLHATSRYIRDIRWTGDGRSATATFITVPAIPPAPNDDPSAGYPPGILRFNFNPRFAITDTVLDRGAYIYPSPSGDRLAVIYRRMHCDPNVRDACRVAAPERAYTSQIYLVEQDGSAARLDGFGDHVLFRGWDRKDTAIFVTPIWPPAGLTRATYRVPIDGGEPTYIGPETGMVVGPELASADGRFLLQRHHQPGDSRVEFIDRATGEARLLADSTPPNYIHAEWLLGEAIILTQGRATVSLVDAESGATREVFQSGEHSIQRAHASPDGSRIAIIEQLGFAGSPSTLCPGLVGPYRLWLYDRQSDDLRIVRDCGDSYATWLDWLPDGRGLVILDPRPRQSEGDQIAVYHVDLFTGRTLPLTIGLEHKGRAAISPDGTRILVTGHALRIYTADGRLLRAIPVPDQSDVVAAAWSPDGQSIIYVLGPRGYFTI